MTTDNETLVSSTLDMINPPKGSAFVTFAIDFNVKGVFTDTDLIKTLMCGIAERISNDGGASFIGSGTRSDTVYHQLNLGRLTELDLLSAPLPFVRNTADLLDGIAALHHEDEPMYPHLVVVFTDSVTDRIHEEIVRRARRLAGRPLYIALVGISHSFDRQVHHLEALGTHLNAQPVCAASTAYLETGALHPGIVRLLHDALSGYPEWIKTYPSHLRDFNSSRQEQGGQDEHARNTGTNDTFEALMDPLVDSIEGVEAALNRAGQEIGAQLTKSGREIGAVLNTEAARLLRRWRNRPR